MLCRNPWGAGGFLGHESEIINRSVMPGLFEILWAAAHQAPLSMGFSRQGYWSGLPFPSPQDLPNPGIELRSPALHMDSLPAEPQGKPKVLSLQSHERFSSYSVLRDTLPQILVA